MAEGDLVVVDTTMSGRHVGDFVLYDEAGDVEQVVGADRARASR